MLIPLTHRLSYKQASLTVLVAFILGSVLSLIQISVDYANEDASIDREIHALLQISHNPASRIAYNIDSELAQELLLGLLQSTSVIRAEIIDNSGGVLASVSRPPVEDAYRIFSDFFFHERRQYEDTLFVNNIHRDSLGVLRLEIDTYPYGSSFLNRATLTLISGFVRSLLLSVILLVLFYFTLTQPLVSLIHALTANKDDRPQRLPLACPPGHEQDEIGVLVRATNDQLQSIARELEQRREAEDRLTEHLQTLEQIVSSRTAELKAANNRLLQSNAELEQAREQALRTARLRSAFLANMSHEIRTPLNGLLGMLSLASDGPLTSEQREQLAIARASGKTLMELLNDILDLSKFEAGQFQIEQIPFDLGSLAEDCTTLLSQNAAPEVELACLVSPQLPSRVLGDPTRTRQIINNLLSNALKFTRIGQVILHVKPTAQGVEISVSDTGIGIATADLERIFQPFVQAAPGITRLYGGTGLGLTLTRRLCQAMHGELVVNSSLGHGSCFTALLPLPGQTPPLAMTALHGHVHSYCPTHNGLQRLLATWLPALGIQHHSHNVLPKALDRCDLLICANPADLSALRQLTCAPLMLVSDYASFLDAERCTALAPFRQLARPLSRQTLLSQLGEVLLQLPDQASASGSSAAVRPAHILLVEDNPVNQMVASGMLRKLGCQVSLAINGREALHLLESQSPELILMDCNMPVMDGYEATRKIRSDARWRELPIIALTANALADERERCLNIGMNDYLAKPFRREDLLEMLQRWLPIPRDASA